jgi:DNA primase
MDPKEEIRQKVDIAELIGEYLTLKPSGMASFKGLCPFHAEKSPSFHVSTDKQIFHCFGCSEGGDCFAFVMKMEGMDFPEALRHLGAKVGVEVKRYDTQEGNDRARLIAVNELAAKFFRKVLTDAPAAQSVRDYVAKRGIDAALQERFDIGFAPDAWDTLAQFLAKKGYPDSDGERGGLLMRRKSGSGMIDRFRNRVMIPLRDQHGNTVGFTGRVLPGATEEMGPKYMNTPETPVYHKGSILFGLDLAKQAIKKAGFVVVVEGNLDVVASHKAGVENVVASSGTALTEEQLSLLKRFTSTIVFSFDRDAAGFNAAQKGIALARAAGFDVRATVLPPEAGKDPDEAVQKDPEFWRTASSQSVPIMQFLIDRATAGRNLNSVDDKRAVSALLLPELKLITDVVEREHWLQSVADLLRTDIGVLRQATAETRGPSSETSRRPHSAPTSGATLRAAGGPVSPPPRLGGAVTQGSKLQSKEDSSARMLVGIIVQDPSRLSAVSRDRLPAPWSELYSLAEAAYHSGQKDPSDTAFFRRLRSSLEASPERAHLVPLLDTAALEAEAFLASVPPKELPGRITELVHTLVAADAKRRRKAIEEDIRRAERAGDREEVERLINSLTSLR